MNYLRSFLITGLSFVAPAFSQTPTCSLSVSPQNLLVVPGSASGALGLILSDPSCAWVGAGSASAWIHQTAANNSHTGNGSLPFSVDANPNPTPRTGTLTIVVLNGSSVDYQVQFLQMGTISPQPFNDVSADHPFALYINQIRTAGLTNGCSLFPPLFCPEDTVTRSQMSAFIVRAAVGSDTFTYTNNPYFDDVPQNHPFFKYIQKLRDLGITTGCSATPALFCPDASVTRLQLAVFLMRGKFGADPNIGNSPTPYYTDVATGTLGFPYIQKMKDFGITTGCTFTQFCPDNPVSRGETAVFLTRLYLTPFLSF
jgi:hypothetical protein